MKGGAKPMREHIEQAHKDYLDGMKYLDIAEKYNVTLNTVKSWKRRYHWEREKKTQAEKGVQMSTNAYLGALPKKRTLLKQRKLIEVDLKKQLEDKGITQKHYIDLVNDYLTLWDIKNLLIADINNRGVVVTWSNGKQVSEKKNDNVNELNKTNSQMLRILADLGLKASELEFDEYDDYV